jgi:hypothetical protein
MLWVAFAFLAALAAALPAFGQESQDPWPTFGNADAKEPIPGLEFSVSYPPWFSRDGDVSCAGLTDEPDLRYCTAWVAAGHDDETDTNSPRFSLSIQQVKLTRKDMREIRKSGIDSFGYGFMRERSDAISGRSATGKALTFKGRPAADVDYIDREDFDNDAVFFTYLFRRLVQHDDILFVMECWSMSENISTEHDFPTRSDPAVARNCVPFLDSLRISE